MTLYNEIPAEIKSRLSDNGAVCFVSKTGNQILFVYRAHDIEEGRVAILSAKCRLTRGSWNPLMLQNYAEMVGLKLDNIRSFQQYFNRE